MILCLGNTVADVLARPFDRLPERGKLERADTIGLALGGCAANAAAVMAKLGDHVRLISAIGNDRFGDVVCDELISAGVDIAGLKRLPEAVTSVSIVCIHSDGERSFFTQVGASSCFDPSMFDAKEFELASHLHFGGFFTMPNFIGEGTAALFAKAKDRGLSTSLDTAWDITGRWFSALEPMLPFVDILMTNEDEALHLAGTADSVKSSGFFIERGAKTVILKQGSKGCTLQRRGEKIVRFPAFAVPTVDSTGAGDCFAAGYVHGMAKGWPAEQCIRFATACGAMCVRAVGATGGISNEKDVSDFILNHGT